MIPLTAAEQRRERRAADIARLKAVRRRLPAFETSSLALAFDEDGPFVEIVRKVSARGRDVGREAPALLARFALDAGSDEAEALAAAPADAAFLARLLDEAIDTINASRAASPLDAAGAPAGRETVRDGQSALPPSADREDTKSAKDYAAEAAMKCGSTLFQKFLGAEGTDDADSRLKARLGIDSKKQLNTDPAAAQRWRDLRAEFDAWGRVE